MGIEAEKPRMFAVIVSMVSPQSLQRIKDWSLWQKVSESYDVVKLWKRIKTIHQTMITGVIEIDGAAALHRLATINMKNGESITDYKNRFDNERKIYSDICDSVESLSMLPDNILSGIFVAGLSVKFCNFKNTLENLTRTKVSSFPKTVNKAYEAASKWKGNDDAPSSNNVSDVIIKTQEEHVLSAGIKKSGVQKSTPLVSKKTGTLIECRVCGENHYATDCPKMKNMIEEVRDEVNRKKDSKRSSSSREQTIF
jgi:hypothetical protein